MTPIHKRQLLITVVGLTVIVGLIIIGTKKVPPVLVPSESVPVQTDTSWPSSEVKKETITDEGKEYNISINYPRTKSEAINTTFKTFAEDQMESFKKDIDWINDPTIDSTSSENQILTLDIDYTNQKSATVDNYLFSIMIYTGGAHGLQVNKAYSFTQAGTQIQLASVFTNGINGLKTIAPYVESELKKRNINDDLEWLTDGSSPTLENYQTFTITDEGITFILSEYQVAPYVAGPQIVSVPLFVFKKIANPNLFTIQ